MSFIVGILLITIGLFGTWLQDAAQQARRPKLGPCDPRQNEVFNALFRTGRDDQGTYVMTYQKQKGYKNPYQAYYDLAKAQCKRNGIPWSEFTAQICCAGCHWPGYPQAYRDRYKMK